MINGDSVEKACLEVGEYSDEEMGGEFERFFRAQPAVCDFIVELTHESGYKIQELSLFLSYMVFKAMDIDRTDEAGAVTPGAIEAAYRESESWIERVSRAEGAGLESAIAASLENDTEPYLLQYVISEINESLKDGTQLSDEEKGEVFFILKTVISSLKPDTKGRIIEID